MKVEVKDGLGAHRTPGWIELWSPNGGQDGLCDRHVPGFGVRYVRYVRYTPLAARYVGILGPGPLCFLFFVFPSRPLPLTPPGRPQTGR